MSHVTQDTYLQISTTNSSGLAWSVIPPNDSVSVCTRMHPRRLLLMLCQQSSSRVPSHSFSEAAETVEKCTGRVVSIRRAIRGGRSTLSSPSPVRKTQTTGRSMCPRSRRPRLGREAKMVCCCVHDLEAARVWPWIIRCVQRLCGHVVRRAELAKPNVPVCLAGLGERGGIEVGVWDRSCKVDGKRVCRAASASSKHTPA